MLGTPPALHVLNLTNLRWLRSECRASHDRAGDLFGIDPATVACYRDLTDLDADTLCLDLDVSLFIPRFTAESLARLAPMTGAADAAAGLWSDLDLHNLRNLQSLHDACRSSSAHAVWVYRIDQETATACGALANTTILALSKGLAASAFAPRYNAPAIAKVLDKPAGSRALFAAAYETEIAVSSEVARRSTYLTH